MSVTTISIDLAKTVFSIHGINQHGKVMVRKRLNRPKLLAFFAQLPLCLHRIRRGLTKERTAQINQIRGLLAEFGLIIPQGRYHARHRIPEILEDAENGLPMLARRLLNNINQRILQLDEEILAYDREIEAMARRDEQAKRLMAIPGIGPQTATAILASAPDPRQFKSGRHLAAWLGLVPRQY